MATRAAVEEFLDTFKAAMDFGRIEVKDRPKNINALVDLGITPNQRIRILKGLSVENYRSGPEEDVTEQGKTVWLFSYDLDGIEVYIKLRLDPPEKPGRPHLAIVWSFHRSGLHDE